MSSPAVRLYVATQLKALIQLFFCVAAEFSVLKHTRYPVQDLSQRGGDGQVQSAVLVACSIRGMLDQVAGGIDASFVQLKRNENSFV